jgi:glycosyltransferase involved in cell wall biosynthesis
MPSYNRGFDLQRILSAYDKQDLGEPFEVVVVDDGSSDSTYEVAKSYKPLNFSLVVERLETNQGSGAARNVALKIARGPILLIVGDDILPEKDFVRQHLAAHTWYPENEIAILGRIEWPDDLPRNSLMEHITGIGAQQFSYHYLVSGEEYDFRHFYTSNISVKMELLNQLDHWFDPDFLHYGFEDIELAYRLRDHGLRILYFSAPLATHYHFHTVWTFAKRQYYAGMMACVFNRKHPGAIGRTPYRMERNKVILKFLAYLTSPLTAKCKDKSDWLEKLSLHLASFYEWRTNPILDRLYVGLLAYYWDKGIIDGIIPEGPVSRRFHDLHACYSLSPLLISHIREALLRSLPLPEGFGMGLVRELSSLRITSIKRPMLGHGISSGKVK